MLSVQQPFYIGEIGSRLGDSIRDHLYDKYVKTIFLNPFPAL